MSKRTLILILFLSILTGVFVYLAVSQNSTKPNQTVTQVTPTKKPVPAYTTLALSPATVTLSANTGSVDVVINTGAGDKKNTVTAVQLEMQYDPKALSTVTIQPGTFIPNATPLVNSIDRTTGRITYAVAIAPSAQGVSGEGVVAKIQFQSTLTNGASTTVSLLPTSLVTASGVAESVLLKSTGATITRGGTSTPASSSAQ